MIKTVRFYLCIAFLLCSFSVQAFAQKQLEIDLASDHIDITAGFTGSDLILFGVKEGEGKLAVVIRGPDKKMTVRKKNSVLGAWMNTETMIFENVPGFYDYALSDELKEYNKDALQKNGIGIASFNFPAQETQDEQDEKAEFLNALIRNKQTQKLFPVEPKSIKLLSDNFFRLSIYIPSNVPVGEYTITTYLLDGQKLLNQKQTTMRVAQVGQNAQIYEFATEKSFFYGLICVFMAVFAGWMINVIRGR